MKFSTRLFLVIFLFNTVTAVVSTYLFLKTFREGEYADLQRNMELLATVAVARYTGYLDRAQAILETVVADRDVRSFFVDHAILREYSRRDARRFLGQLVESNPSVSDVVISTGEERISMIGCKTSERSRIGSFVLSCDGERAYAVLSSPAGESSRVELLVDLQRFADTRVAPLLEEGSQRIALLGPGRKTLSVTGALLGEGREWVEREGLSATGELNRLNRQGNNFTFVTRQGDLSFVLASPVSAFNKRLVETSR